MSLEAVIGLRLHFSNRYCKEDYNNSNSNSSSNNKRNRRPRTPVKTGCPPTSRTNRESPSALFRLRQCSRYSQPRRPLESRPR